MAGSDKNKSDRRSFFASLLNGRKTMEEIGLTEKPEMVKMLTPDGKLVEIEKAVLDRISKNQKATNSEIFNWMDNPSKK